MLLRTIALIVIFAYNAFSQELNCKITVQTIGLTTNNKQIFQRLEDELNNLMNNATWTDRQFNTKEKINCSFLLNIESYESNRMKATLQVISKRPVYNSIYSSNVINIIEKDVGFTYGDFDKIVFNTNQYVNEITSIFMFYGYLIIGFDNDTFSEQGGDYFFNIAENIAQFSRAYGGKQWQLTTVKDSRFKLISQINDSRFQRIRLFLYEFYRKGLDLLVESPEKAKDNIYNKIMELKKVGEIEPNATIIKTILRTKAEEIKNIFKNYDSQKKLDMGILLGSINPENISLYQTLSQ